MMMIFFFLVLAFRLALMCVCVCCPSFVAETGFSFFPSSIGTKFRRPPVDSHPYHHPFQIRRHLLSQKETNALNERERNIKRTLFLCVCVCVSRVGHSNSFLKKKISSLSLASLQFVMTSCCCCTEPCV